MHTKLVIDLNCIIIVYFSQAICTVTSQKFMKSILYVSHTLFVDFNWVLAEYFQPLPNSSPALLS